MNTKIGKRPLRKRSGFVRDEELTAYGFIAPALLLILAFFIVPLINGLYLSLTDWNGFGKPQFVGLDNFVYLFSDPKFYNALGATLLYGLIMVTGVMLIGFFLALALHCEVPGWRAFQVIFFMNCVLPSTVIGVLWGNLLHPIMGPVNLILKALNIPPPLWLGDYKIALLVIALIAVWQYSGYTMLFIFTAMQDIPVDLYEAADLDGITFWKKVRHIILPMTKPVLKVVLLLQIINAFKTFDIVYTLTKGGPGNATEVLGLFLYNQGFWFKRYGYGSSIAVVMLVCVLFVSIFYLRSMRAEPNQDKGR